MEFKFTEEHTIDLEYIGEVDCIVNTGAEQVIEYEERFPPDTTACIFWLKNRQNANWRDRRDVEHSGTLTLAQALKALEAEDE